MEREREASQVPRPAVRGADDRRPGGGAWPAVALLGCSALAIAAAPLAMPAGYSWVANAISESAAQSQENAWVARLGFLLMGFAVLWLTRLGGRRWGRAARIFHGTFGVLMVSTAAFSHRPWQAGVAFDGFEDFLHSVTATGMGLAFAAGVAAVLIGCRSASVVSRGYDFVAIAASVVLPLGMSAWPAIAGGLQRLMFLIAYVWYGAEALRMAAFRAEPGVAAEHEAGA